MPREDLIEAIMEAYGDSPSSARRSHLRAGVAQVGFAAAAGATSKFLYDRSSQWGERSDNTKSMIAGTGIGAGIIATRAALNIARGLQKDPRQSPYVFSRRKGQKVSRPNKRKNFKGYLWHKS